MSPSRASARTVSESMRTLTLSLGATSSSIACMIEGAPAITITLPIQKLGAPDKAKFIDETVSAIDSII